MMSKLLPRRAYARASRSAKIDVRPEGCASPTWAPALPASRHAANARQTRLSTAPIRPRESLCFTSRCMFTSFYGRRNWEQRVKIAAVVVQTMLIDLYLPQYDVRERHRTRVAAPPETVYAALRSADLAASPIVRTLFLLRALPVALARRRAGVQALLSRQATPVTLATFESLGFRLLEALPPTELVLGIEGKFWRQTSRLCTPAATAFLPQPLPPGTARGR